MFLQVWCGCSGHFCTAQDSAHCLSTGEKTNSIYLQIKTSCIKILDKFTIFGYRQCRLDEFVLEYWRSLQNPQSSMIPGEWPACVTIRYNGCSVWILYLHTAAHRRWRGAAQRRTQVCRELSKLLHQTKIGKIKGEYWELLNSTSHNAEGL